MSAPVNGAPQEAPRGGGAAQEAAGDADVDSVTKTDGEWEIQLRTTAVEGRSGGATAQELKLKLAGYLRLKDDDSREAQRRRWFKEMRGWLMVLATVAASVTYQAGLNPPGGFWQDNPGDGSHRAGDPALRDEHHSRYLLFYYFNATAFVMSLVIMVMLMSERFYHSDTKVVALMFTTFVDLVSLIGAYIAGSTRYFSSCIYVIVIACVAFAGVICIGEVMTEICVCVMTVFPCMETLAQKRWCPVPAGVVKNAKKKKGEMVERCKSEKKRHDAGTNNSGTCSMCCA